MEDKEIVNVVLVRTRDQDVLYVDNEKVSNDGAYDLPDYIDGRLVRFSHRHRLDCDQNWEDNVGALPDSFDEVLENENMWEEDHRDDEDEDDDDSAY